MVLATASPLVAACASCDARSRAQAEAGARAVDCGFAPIDADRAPVVTCIDDAIARGVPFFGGWALAGIDSTLTTYVVERPDGSRLVLANDSLDDSLTGHPCGSEWTHFGTGREVTVSCSGDPFAGVALCD